MCFVFHGDKVLLIEASKTKEWSGTWDPVGGHIEKGESILDSARREIQEESELEISDISLAGVVHVSNFYGKDIMMFVTKAYATTTDVYSDGREGTLHWVKVSQIDTEPVIADVGLILRQMLESNSVFTARSRFVNGKLAEFTFD
jgi:8-oxo-dGTP diphosphatase